MTVRTALQSEPEARADVVIVGAGAAGLCAALSAREAGASVVVIERDAEPRGNTALTLGMLPGAGTRFQREKGIEDSPDMYVADILAKAKGKTDESLARKIAEESGPAVEWLVDSHGLHFELLDDILYPGHSRHRYHVPKSRTGLEMEQGLLRAALSAGATLITSATVDTHFAEPEGRITAIGYTTADGQQNIVGCGALVLASGGYGADPSVIAALIPSMSDAVYCGHGGSKGDAIRWGDALGAATADLGSYQGHCVANGPALPVTWAIVIRGGFQVNKEGRRFSNEMSGYSEQASTVLGQPGGTAWTIYDKHCEEAALTFQDYHRVLDSGAVVTADGIASLSQATGLPFDNLEASFSEVASYVTGKTDDPFGRDFTGVAQLTPPFRAVEVKGALFHTQGGLKVDETGRVVRADGSPLPNLYAAGGAARGISGPSSWGYLGGNGLVTAVVLGRLAGNSAAKIALT
ncbi:FAD-dependent oxidoreductase [Microvirga guangxiensis]|uniref:Fumarate reductase flavoprotein subunit n=1 Tax=Microvirga guangxiensis TaxID=549386 RepID=A0A1G5LAG2_9HYPH|nr:FAD-dependent oxidoreductase [Microvirga guangxiensis]SCZ09953.1 fumarate reductase flavoprotein subunit [Microvirga guangxiensis]